MTNLKNGFIAGFVATALLSVLMVIKGKMGMLPDLDVAGMLSNMLGTPLAMGWVAHFVIGTLAWGGGFALFYSVIPGGNAIVKGIVLGIATWLAIMVVVMPMAGAGFFGLKIGVPAPVMTLILHIIFGAVLGWVYSALTPATKT
ncbi:MAG: DUF6789 family protein [Pseudomonadota bacterium]